MAMNITYEISFHASVTCCNRDLHFSHPIILITVEAIHHSIFPLLILLCGFKSPLWVKDRQFSWKCNITWLVQSFIKWKSYIYIQHFSNFLENRTKKTRSTLFFFLIPSHFSVQFGHLSFLTCASSKTHEARKLHISKLLPRLWHVAV